MKKLKYTPEIRERAVQLLIESEKDYPSNWAAITAIAPKIGCTPETLRVWYQKYLDQQNPLKYSSFQIKNVLNNSNVKIKNCNVPMKFYVKQPLFSPRRSSTAHTNNGGFYP
jgi:transposase